MKKQCLGFWALGLLAMFAFLGAAYAVQQVPDNITMDHHVFEKHKKPLVKFSHKKHNVEYKLPCTQCHHVIKDAKNIWKQGDEVKPCTQCHKEAKAPKGQRIDKAEKIKHYYYDAIHAKCVGCHKAEKKQGKKAPTACKGCHPKK